MRLNPKSRSNLPASGFGSQQIKQSKVRNAMLSQWELLEGLIETNYYSGQLNFFRVQWGLHHKKIPTLAYLPCLPNINILKIDQLTRSKIPCSFESIDHLFPLALTNHSTDIEESCSLIGCWVTGHFCRYTVDPLLNTLVPTLLGMGNILFIYLECWLSSR